jgi:hypothetical protein
VVPDSLDWGAWLDQAQQVLHAWLGEHVPGEYQQAVGLLDDPRLWFGLGLLGLMVILLMLGRPKPHVSSSTRERERKKEATRHRRRAKGMLHPLRWFGPRRGHWRIGGWRWPWLGAGD